MGVEARLRATEGRVAAANGLDVQERWVDIASPPGRVRVLESGVGDPVLFLNGISAPGIGMAPLAGRLPGRRHLLVDLPGHGLSPPYLWQGAPVREQAVNVIAGVLDGLGIDQVTLVGNSLGGLFSLWFALDQPSRVARAVIVGQPAVAIAGLARRPDHGHAHRAGPRPGRDLDGVAALAPIRRAAWACGTRVAHMRRGRCRTTSSTCTCSRCGWPGQAASFRSLQKRLLTGRTPRPENVLTDAELRSFTVPLLFVWPENDRFLAPAAGKPSVDKIPGARFVTMPGGHFPWYDDPDQCAALVAEGL